jgi:hypothetical protein
MISWRTIFVFSTRAFHGKTRVLPFPPPARILRNRVAGSPYR